MPAISQLFAGIAARGIFETRRAQIFVNFQIERHAKRTYIQMAPVLQVIGALYAPRQLARSRALRQQFQRRPAQRDAVNIQNRDQVLAIAFPQAGLNRPGMRIGFARLALVAILAERQTFGQHFAHHAFLRQRDRRIHIRHVNRDHLHGCTITL